jgi:hypothetical protein
MDWFVLSRISTAGRFLLIKIYCSSISCQCVIIHFPLPDGQQPFSGFKAQSVENTPFGATLSAVETLQNPAGCQGV